MFRVARAIPSALTRSARANGALLEPALTGTSTRQPPLGAKRGAYVPALLTSQPRRLHGSHATGESDPSNKRSAETTKYKIKTTRQLPKDGLSLKDFLGAERHDEEEPVPSSYPTHMETSPQPVNTEYDPHEDHGCGGVHAPSEVLGAIPQPVFKLDPANSNNTSGSQPRIQLRSQTYYLETYGCQMNVSDSELVHSILLGHGLRQVSAPEQADVILVNTCAVREGAEQRIWGRLGTFKAIVASKSPRIRQPTPITATLGAKEGGEAEATATASRILPHILEAGPRRSRSEQAPIVGVLGCMAERLKSKLLESDKIVDLVAGPDAYRDIPRLISLVEGGSMGMNVQLSIDETYADIAPVRRESNQISAFVSITRGCDNMCSYCIVPYTRGRERSRKAESIVEEIKQLAEQGYKEVTLLGQNVNSYNDTSVLLEGEGERGSKRVPLQDTFEAAAGPGFKNISRRAVKGVTFAQLLERISDAVPNMRIRFTSPHPKDFGPDVISVVASRPNICKQLHLPVQSGSTTVLARMRRGYSKDAYLELVENIRKSIPHVALSSDIIAGFCGETWEEHADTVDVQRKVKYDHAFMFKYSQREKTHAHRAYKDDVSEEDKSKRLDEIITTHHEVLKEIQQREVGRVHLVLVEGVSRRSDQDLTGRTDTNKSVNFPARKVPLLAGDALRRLDVSKCNSAEDVAASTQSSTDTTIVPGAFVAVRITEAKRTTLAGEPLFQVPNLQEYYQNINYFCGGTLCL